MCMMDRQESSSENMKFISLKCIAVCVISTSKVYATECDTIYPGTSTFGFDCKYHCHCVDDRKCDSLGQCSNGCRHGWMGPGCQYRNVATDLKAARQNGPNTNIHKQPENAIDNRQQTCSETSVANFAGRHSLSIELRHDYEVVGITLHVPENSAELFREFKLETGQTNSYFSDLCYVHPNVSGSSVMEITCQKPVITKNIRISLAIENVPLRLCEVEIYGGRQVSFNMPTTQSTSLLSMPSWKAVDGRFVTTDDDVETMEVSTCSATKGNENRPWWLIDLQHQYRVQGIDFYGKLSSLDQSKGFHISIGSSPNMTRDIFIDIPVDSSVGDDYQPKSIILVPPLEMQILKIEIRPQNTTAQLSICELYILADCPKNKCGWDCMKDCFCSNEITGTWKVNGTCPYGCAGRWTGVNGACDTECSQTSWGERCQNRCGNCLDLSCDVRTGICRRGCGGHWIPPFCTQACSDGSFGVNCTNRCGHCLNSSTCEQENGMCQHGCDPGWQGLLCDTHCPDGFFGNNCSYQCGQCKDSHPCDPVSGVCTEGCHIGFLGPNCDIDFNLLSRIKNETTLRMSSVFKNWNKENIIDNSFVGNPETCKCCAGTKNDVLSWIEIDLGNMYSISSVNVYGRMNEKTFDHMTGFNLYLMNDTTDTPELFYSNGIIKNDMVQINVPNILTRLLRFNRPGTLTICEIQIIEGACQIGYFGTDCSKQCHCADGKSCDRHNGTCVTPICDIGFTGASCSEECLSSTFGIDCSRQCHCFGGYTCSKEQGICPMGCADGYEGDHCENGLNLIQKIKIDTKTEMSSTFYDWSSEKAIDNNIGTQPHQCKCCSSTLNHLLSWWRIDLGMVYLLNGVEIFGSQDDSDVQHTNDFKIILKNHTDEQGYLEHANLELKDDSSITITMQNYLARIIEVQRPGKLTICELKAYEGDCPLGQYGNNCGHFCHCADGKQCVKTDGRCSSPFCSAGWEGWACNEYCASGYYGKNCSMVCGQCKDAEHCDHKTGICQNGCSKGYHGLFCTEKVSCKNGYYGKQCGSKCGACQDLGKCDSETGICISGCASGYTGPLCNSRNETEPRISKSNSVGSNIKQTDGTNPGMIALYSILSILAVGIGGGVTFYCHCRKGNSDEDLYANINEFERQTNPPGAIEMKNYIPNGKNITINNNIYTVLPGART